MTKFTKEFIAEQRKKLLEINSKLSVGKQSFRIAVIWEYLNSLAEALDEIERRGTWIECLQRSVKSAVQANLEKHCEIERLNTIIAEIKRTLKSDSEKYSWEVAGVNALRLIELNMEGGEDDR